MSAVLYISANPKAVEESFCLSTGKTFLESYKRTNPEDQIIVLDLYKMEIPSIDTDVFTGWGKLQQGVELSTEEQRKVNQINQLCDQFIKADKYIFVTPMWNLSIPAIMKAYIDTICIAGKTFKYTASGPVGLLENKKAVHIQARGGMYSEGPKKDWEFGDKYIHAILTFLGVTSIESIIIEGMAQTPDKADQIKQKALDQAQQVAGRF